MRNNHAQQAQAKKTVIDKLEGAAKSLAYKSLKDKDEFIAAMVQFGVPDLAVGHDVFRAGFGKAIPKDMLHPSSIKAHKIDLGNRVREAVGEEMRGRRVRERESPLGASVGAVWIRSALPLRFRKVSFAGSVR